VTKFETPKEDAGFFLTTAKAIETSLSDFKGAARPYNVAVLPAASKSDYVMRTEAFQKVKGQ